jgi:hypothetical protein
MIDLGRHDNGGILGDNLCHSDGVIAVVWKVLS